MVELVSKTPVTTALIMDRIAEVKYNPSAIQRVVLDVLDSAMNGTLDIVDPSNPFVFLLEASAVSTATANRESMISMRKQHPQLAQVDKDLYAHMSDADYIGRFSNPAYATFTFITTLDDLQNRGSLDLVLNCDTLTIPRNTSITVDGFCFTTQYPIDIRLHYAPTVDGIPDSKDISGITVSYDTSDLALDDEFHPVQTLSDNNLKYRVVTHPEGMKYILFDVYIPQLSITSVEATINASTRNVYTIPFTDKYYTAKVYTLQNLKWVNVHTTHSDQVFDPLSPTVLLKVVGQELEVTVPVSYIRSELISSSLRIDIQTTKGSIYLNLGNYVDDAFVREFNIIDRRTEYTPAVDGMVRSTLAAISKELIVGGTDAMDFATLRAQVISNSIGHNQLPITNAQLDTYVQSRGFNLIKNVDLVTNRIFLASRSLPPPVIEQLLTPANIGISAIVFNINVFSNPQGYKIDYNVSDDGLRITILNDTLYLINPFEQLDFISQYAYDEIVKDPVSILNSGRYLYSPFYYALNMEDSEYTVRAYDLDRPEAVDLNFLYQNLSLMAAVNTVSYSVMKSSNSKKEDGLYVTYDLYMGYDCDTHYAGIPVTTSDFQLAFYPNGSKDLVYITPTTVDTAKKMVIFKIKTYLEMDANDCMMVQANYSNESRPRMVPMQLSTQVYMFYNTESITDTFTRSKYDSMINSGVFSPSPKKYANITAESFTLTLGYSLNQLWTRVRTFGAPDYLRQFSDEPRLYLTDVYASNPATGSIFTFHDDGLKLPMKDANGEVMYDSNGDILYEYNMPGTSLSYTKLHSAGDPVIGDDGLPEYIWRAGDMVVIDGNAVTTRVDIGVDMDLLLVDARYRYATDSNFTAYVKSIPAVITNWVIYDIADMQRILLEQTKIYFYAATSLSLIPALCDELPLQQIPSEQSFKLKLYVKADIYNNLNTRTSIRTSTVKTIHALIGALEVKMTDITTALAIAYGDGVVSFDISKLGIDGQYSIVRVLSPHQRLCVKKVLTVQDDRTSIVADDIKMDFYLIE